MSRVGHVWLFLVAILPSSLNAATPTPPASRPAPPPTADQLVQRLVEKANQVLDEPLAPGAPGAQAKVVLQHRGERVHRLAEPLVGQRVSVLTPIADVFETAK